MNGVVTRYTLNGKNVAHMTRGSDDLHFFYDAQNRPAVVVYNGTAYAYVKNLQGDIVAILDQNGNAVVEYTYDAWGNPTSKTGSMASTLGVLNPFRYRGYVYDEETGLYYLKSRYYNPGWCRFVNADRLLGNSGLISFNLFAYCRNAVTGYVDSFGLEAEPVQHYIICPPGVVLDLGSGVMASRGNLIVSRTASGDGIHSWIRLEGYDTAVEIENIYISNFRPYTIVDAYGVDEMQLGDESEYVRNLQIDLKLAGVYQGPIDGIYGYETYAAVKAFKAKYGGTDNGNAGPSLKNLLFLCSYVRYDEMQGLYATAYWEGFNDGREYERHINERNENASER